MKNDFDPNGPGISGKLFGLPFEYQDSNIIVIPVPWDVTVSYNDGTSSGPEAVLVASSQVDLYHEKVSNPWKNGIYMLPVDPVIKELNSKMRSYARDHISLMESGVRALQPASNLEKINESCAQLNSWLAKKTEEILVDGKIPVVLGGDHSTPYGYIEVLSQKCSFGILQIDAHADLRTEYEGFKYSHASIMDDVLQLENVEKLVQVGVRDLCEEEANKIKNDERIVTFFDSQIKAEIFKGGNWAKIAERIINALPDNIYVSFDIDGLDPSLCPNTGTPVPGGLSFEMSQFLFEAISRSKKNVIGFDLCEVAPGVQGEWDANVGARVLYQMIAYLT